MPRKKKPGGFFGDKRKEAEAAFASIGDALVKLSKLVSECYRSGCAESRLYKTTLLKIGNIRERLLYKNERPVDEVSDATEGEQAAVES